MTLLIYFKLSFRHFPDIILTVSPWPSLEIKNTLKSYYVTIIPRNTYVPVWGKVQIYLKKSYSYIREWKKIWLRCISNGYWKKLRLEGKKGRKRNDRIKIVVGGFVGLFLLFALLLCCCLAIAQSKGKSWGDMCFLSGRQLPGLWWSWLCCKECLCSTLSRKGGPWVLLRLIIQPNLFISISIPCQHVLPPMLLTRMNGTCISIGAQTRNLGASLNFLFLCILPSSNYVGATSWNIFTIHLLSEQLHSNYPGPEYHYFLIEILGKTY